MMEYLYHQKIRFEPMETRIESRERGLKVEKLHCLYNLQTWLCISLNFI